jgi:hypothetical protein
MAFITGYLRPNGLEKEGKLMLHDAVYKKPDETFGVPAGANFVEVDTGGMSKSINSTFRITAMRVSADSGVVSILETYGDPRDMRDVYFWDVDSGLLGLGFSKRRVEKRVKSKIVTRLLC